MMIFTSRKGQLYVVVAIIVCVVLAGLFRSSFALKYDTSTVQLEQLCDHFRDESGVLINSLILQDQDVIGNYDVYAKEYLRYGRSINHNFGVFYILSYENVSVVRNMLDRTLCVNTDIYSDCLSPYPLANYDELTKRVKEVSYEFEGHLYNITVNNDADLSVLCIYKRINKDISIKLY